mmetsp:Transcript_6201/g.9646  ORF Transcript_6201/g.9646 Transcript_6201/m.9646 type:complete len:232 (-) Transcript_6201:802-1497(-)
MRKIRCDEKRLHLDMCSLLYLNALYCINPSMLWRFTSIVDVCFRLKVSNLELPLSWQDRPRCGAVCFMACNRQVFSVYIKIDDFRLACFEPNLFKASKGTNCSAMCTRTWRSDKEKYRLGSRYTSSVRDAYGNGEQRRGRLPQWRQRSYGTASGGLCGLGCTPEVDLLRGFLHPRVCEFRIAQPVCKRVDDLPRVETIGAAWALGARTHVHVHHRHLVNEILWIERLTQSS